MGGDYLVIFFSSSEIRFFKSSSLARSSLVLAAGLLDSAFLALESFFFLSFLFLASFYGNMPRDSTT